MLKFSILMALLLLSGAVIAKPLPESVERDVVVLADQGDKRVTSGDYRGAIESYREALTLLPQPVGQWSECGWLMVSIGDSQFQAGDFQAARTTLRQAMGCPGAQWNPFVRLRLGQTHLELGECDRAADELVWVLASVGLEIFEDEHPKYLNFTTHLLERTPDMSC